ncbi:hypothetical protein NDA11_004542 [Ustilago hordei]|uniref:Uncharacterized protein n=1 Tax=Ustilago hordei TaxID=120017 RepID=I2FYC0_USTHO|nr:uncharacterized protein UHO2_04040 [Ustilago hordei]KAJ1037258.1 hypothetical protein NDA10_000186 [Ustilago hordei]KAJ1579842.1 hypothetical protein NDA15_000647 [Ustilago hordei]KAJ1582000.1 hypothetical protein NDA12_007317 [Ustilago hordei]KAJ1582479.1 hypothetical protein NDA11_004542 [Ustilago hordei]KAJ1600206.1 hypothetical protein NDA14_003666 [Ustilago hordei]
MEEETYGTPNAPKDGQLLKFTFNDDKEQIISHLSIMIECVSVLYQGMHDLGPFTNCSKLGKQMHARVNLFIANKEWNAACILDLKIKGSVKVIQNTEQFDHLVKREALVSARSDTPTLNLNVTNVTSCHLIGCEAMPGPTPELSTLMNYHLKVLLGLNDKMKWDEQDLLDPRLVSVHAWQCKMFTMLLVVPFAQNVLN